MYGGRPTFDGLDFGRHVVRSVTGTTWVVLHGPHPVRPLIRARKASEVVLGGNFRPETVHEVFGGAILQFERPTRTKVYSYETRRETALIFTVIGSAVAVLMPIEA
jgi:hypothetical protein